MGGGGGGVGLCGPNLRIYYITAYLHVCVYIYIFTVIVIVIIVIIIVIMIVIIIVVVLFSLLLLLLFPMILYSAAHATLGWYGNWNGMDDDIILYYIVYPIDMFIIHD